MNAPTSQAPGAARAALVLGALGVVFGDIGTSPIYTIQTVFNPGDPHPVAGEHRQHLRDRLDDLLVGDDRRHGHLRAARHARRQRRRGRHHGADHADPRRQRRRGAGRKLVLAALGIFGASLFLGDSMITPAISVLSAVEGLKVAEPVAGRPGRPDHGGDHRRAVPAAAPGHRGRRAPVRPGDDRLVPRHRRVRRARHRRPPGDPQGAVADLRAGLLLRPLLDRVLRAGRGRARGHRRRGALRRHGALRARADHPRLAVARVPGVHPELPGPGRADPRRPAATSAARSSCSSRLGALAAGASWPPRRR